MADKMRFKFDVYDGNCNYAVYAASGMDCGDMVQWDTGARKATPMTTASGAIFLGVSQGTQPLRGIGVLGTGTALTGDVVRVKSNGVHNMKSTASEVYSHLDPVYMGADAQTVSKVGSGRMIGRVWKPDGNQITGATGTDVPVSIYGSQTNNSTVPSSADAAR